MKLRQLFTLEWDAIVGVIAAVAAIVLHLLHIIAEGPLITIAVLLIALLFIRDLRRERATEQAYSSIASAAASLGQLGYEVLCFCFQDGARRAHSIAAQGGINAAKNYQNDGDSVYRLFYDTATDPQPLNLRPRSSTLRRAAWVLLARCRGA
jgi:hypothetical protein